MSNTPILKVGHDTWPFSESKPARLELVYSLNTKLGGRDPTTRAVFRGLVEREFYLLEMNWRSLPRLVPGRIFSESPHITSGKQSEKEFITKVFPNSVEVLTLKEAQSKLDSTSLYSAFEQDDSLPKTKIFHWYDDEGAEYWLPIIEFIRKLFVRSPEMARAIIMYDGWEELVEDYTLHGNTLDIIFTKHPQVGDIQHLALLASKPNLLDAWKSISNCLPRAGSRATVDLVWPFIEPITIHFIAKQRGNQFWVQELLDVKDMNIPYEIIIPHHPSYIDRTYEGERIKGKTEATNDAAEDDILMSEMPFNPAITSTVPSHRSSTKVYMHIQTGSLSAFEQIKVMPEYNEVSEKSKKVGPNTSSTSQQIRETKERRDLEACLTDAISTQDGKGHESSIANVYTKELDNNQLIESNLKGFIDAVKHTKKALGKEATLNWIVQGSPLILPDKCGSRWFLKIDGDIDRLWCLAYISYEGLNYYFLEVGRGENEKKFSLSTLMVTNIDQKPSCNEWLKMMIKNNGNWDTKYFKKEKIEETRLHHLCKTVDVWGQYIANKIN